MPDEPQKRHCTWLSRVYLETRRSQSADDARAFMEQVEEKAPFMVQTVLTDNASRGRENASPGEATLRSGMPGPCHQASPEQTETADERHGRMLQRPHQRRTSDSALCLRRGSGADIEPLYLALQSSHPAEVAVPSIPMEVVKAWRINVLSYLPSG